ncbi:ADP-heptose synthase [Candidatus Pacearchaeota archaeon]|nr:ADP-heptose synthase [Candidatus Pacearchaeota archaeon]|tara:strand:+ start:999 stop:1487 length:489 start_codon:yes stop_codon:yes gene_type:complete
MRNKIINEDGVKKLQHRITGNRQDRQWKLVATNGCFDVVHRGHVEYLRQAKELGDILLVGLNSDESIKLLKGENRPINDQEDRAVVLSAFEFVDYIYIFNEKRASNFLKLARPDVYCKAGDYSLETLDESEKCMLNLCGTEVVFLPLVEGRSSTKTIERLST